MLWIAPSLVLIQYLITSSAGASPPTKYAFDHLHAYAHVLDAVDQDYIRNHVVNTSQGLYYKWNNLARLSYLLHPWEDSWFPSLVERTPKSVEALERTIQSYCFEEDLEIQWRCGSWLRRHPDTRPAELLRAELRTRIVQHQTAERLPDHLPTWSLPGLPQPLHELALLNIRALRARDLYQLLQHLRKNALDRHSSPPRILKAFSLRLGLLFECLPQHLEDRAQNWAKTPEGLAYLSAWANWEFLPLLHRFSPPLLKQIEEHLRQPQLVRGPRWAWPPALITRWNSSLATPTSFIPTSEIASISSRSWPSLYELLTPAPIQTVHPFLGITPSPLSYYSETPVPHTLDLLEAVRALNYSWMKMDVWSGDLSHGQVKHLLEHPIAAFPDVQVRTTLLAKGQFTGPLSAFQPKTQTTPSLPIIIELTDPAIQPIHITPTDPEVPHFWNTSMPAINSSTPLEKNQSRNLLPSDNGPEYGISLFPILKPLQPIHRGKREVLAQPEPERPLPETHNETFPFQQRSAKLPGRLHQFLLQAYDCSFPSQLHQKRIPNEEDCSIPVIKEDKPTAEQVQVFLFRAPEWQRLEGAIQCRHVVSRTAFYCGWYDYSTPMHHLEFRDRVEPVSEEDCRKWASSKTFTEPITQKQHLISIGKSPLLIQVVGETTHWEDNHAGCKGGDFQVTDADGNVKVYSRSLIQDYHEIELYYPEIDVHRDGRVRQLENGYYKPILGTFPGESHSIQPDGSIFVWPPQDAFLQDCPLEIFRTTGYTVQLFNSSTEQYYVVSHDPPFVLGFREERPQRIGNPDCYKDMKVTDHTDIYLALGARLGTQSLKDPDNYTLGEKHRTPVLPFQLPTSTHSLESTLDDSDLKLRHLALLNRGDSITLVNMAAQAMCEDRRHRVLRNLRPHDVDVGVVYSVSPGRFAEKTGETISTYNCRSILVQPIAAEQCYEGLLVVPTSKEELSPLMQKEDYFYLEPNRRRLLRHHAFGEERPCDSPYLYAYPLIPTRHSTAPPKYICVSSNTIVSCEGPAEPNAHTTIHLDRTFERAASYSHSIADYDDMATWQRHVDNSQRNDVIIARTIGAAGELLFTDKGYSVGEWSRLLGKLDMGGIWPFFCTFFTVFLHASPVILILLVIYRVWKGSVSLYICRRSFKEHWADPARKWYHTCMWGCDREFYKVCTFGYVGDAERQERVDRKVTQRPRLSTKVSGMRRYVDEKTTEFRKSFEPLLLRDEPDEETDEGQPPPPMKEMRSLHRLSGLQRARELVRNTIRQAGLLTNKSNDLQDEPDENFNYSSPPKPIIREHNHQRKDPEPVLKIIHGTPDPRYRRAVLPDPGQLAGEPTTIQPRSRLGTTLELPKGLDRLLPPPSPRSRSNSPHTATSFGRPPQLSLSVSTLERPDADLVGTEPLPGSPTSLASRRATSGSHHGGLERPSTEEVHVQPVSGGEHYAQPRPVHRVLPTGSETARETTQGRGSGDRDRLDHRLHFPSNQLGDVAFGHGNRNLRPTLNSQPNTGHDSPHTQERGEG